MSDDVSKKLSELENLEKILQGVDPNVSQGSYTNVADASQNPTQQNMQNSINGEIKTGVNNNQRKQTKRKNTLLGKIIKYFMLMLVLVSSCFLILFAIYVTGLDLRFTKISINISVTDQAGKAIPGVNVFLNDAQIGLTDVKGTFEITGLDKGTAEIKLQASDYLDFIEVLNVDRNFLDYTIDKNIKLISSVKATLNGKFEPILNNYKFNDAFVVIKSTSGEVIQEMKLSEDGNFSLAEVGTGNIIFELRTPDFIDISREIELKPGINNISSINLTPAGDILESYQSYVTNSFIQQINILIENHDPNLINVNYDEQNFLIKDLLVGQKYKIRIEAEGFETRDYEVTIQQGYNEIFDLIFVEQGRAVFYGELNDSNRFHIFTSDFDGKDFIQLTDINNLDLENIFYNKETDRIYFTTEIDRVRSVLGGNTQIVYELNPETKVLNKVTTNTQNLGRVFTNFIAGKIVNIYKNDRRDLAFRLETRNIDGTQPIFIKTTNDNYVIGNLFLSNDSNLVYTQETDNTSKKNYIFVTEVGGQTKLVSDKTESTILSLSSSGKNLIFMAKETSSNFFDLFIYNYDTSQTRRIFTNYQGLNAQFLGESENEFIFFRDEAGLENIYRFDLESNSEEQVTRLTQIYDINSIYQQSGYVFYSTNRGLHILDPEKVQNFKLVKEGDWVVR